MAVDSGAQVVVGVNRFATAEPVTIDLLQVDPEVERQQVERVRQVRASRSRHQWTAALDAVGLVARSGGNLMPPIVGAVEAHATVGEISDVLRGVFGEYRDCFVG